MIVLRAQWFLREGQPLSRRSRKRKRGLVTLCQKKNRLIRHQFVPGKRSKYKGEGCLNLCKKEKSVPAGKDSYLVAPEILCGEKEV